MTQEQDETPQAEISDVIIKKTPILECVIYLPFQTELIKYGSIILPVKKYELIENIVREEAKEKPFFFSPLSAKHKNIHQQILLDRFMPQVYKTVRDSTATINNVHAITIETPLITMEQYSTVKRKKYHNTFDDVESGGYRYILVDFTILANFGLYRRVEEKKVEEKTLLNP